MQISTNLQILDTMRGCQYVIRIYERTATENEVTERLTKSNLKQISKLAQ